MFKYLTASICSVILFGFSTLSVFHYANGSPTGEDRVGFLSEHNLVQRESLSNDMFADSVAANSAGANSFHDASVAEEDLLQKVRIEKQLAYADNIAKVEGVDQKWAVNATVDLLEAFKKHSNEGVNVSDVNCHSSFCQARVRLDGTDIGSSISKLQTLSPWHGETVVWIENVENGEGIIYMAREGFSLPAFASSEL